MQNTCVSSTLSLRCNGSLSFSFNDYSCCSNYRFCRHPFAHASQLLVHSSSPSSFASCCACCSNANANFSVYKVPIAPAYLYGLRQSTLIQYTPCKRVNFNGLDGVFTRLSGCDVNRRCYCGEISKFGGKGVFRKRNGWGKRRYGCLVHEESGEGFSFGDSVDDEAEVMLSLLTEGVSEEGLDVGRRSEGGYKKILVEEKGNGSGQGVSYRSKKKNVGSGILENGSKFEFESAIKMSRYENERRSKERPGNKKEAVLRRGGQRVVPRKEEREGVLRESCDGRERKEERDKFVRKSHKERVRVEEREDSLRDLHRETAREEQREELLRREEHMQRLRKDGSSCSSYYSLSSMGEYESDGEIQVKQEYEEGFSSKYKSNSRRHGEISLDGKAEKHQDYQKEQGLVLKKGKKTEGDEWNWRKESEKKLTDISAQEAISQMDSDVHDSVYGKGSYQKYVGREEKATSVMESIQGRREQRRHTSDHAHQQSGSIINYKQFKEQSESYGANVGTSSSSQIRHSREEGTFITDSRVVKEARKGHYKEENLNITEEDYWGKSDKLTQPPSTLKLDIRMGSSSEVISGTARKDKGKDITTGLSYVYDPRERHHQAGQSDSQLDSRKNSQPLIEEVDTGRTSVFQRSSTSSIQRQEETSTLVYGSYQDSVEQRSQTNEGVWRLDSRMGMEKSTGTSLASYKGTGTTDAGRQSRRKSEAIVSPPIAQRLERGALHADSTSGLAIEEVPYESLPSDAARETHGGGREGKTDGQPLLYISHEDALASAELLQKSSSYYVGEFLEKVSHEILEEDKFEKQSHQTDMEQDYEHVLEALTESIPEDLQLKELGSRSRHSSPGPRTKGPSVEMWDVTEPSNQERTGAEVLDDRSSAGDVTIKRTGGSLWHMIADIVRLRWASRSTNRSETGKSGGRNSLNQSTSSETWFSGNDPDENIYKGDKNKNGSVSQESSPVKKQKKAKARSRSRGESSSSSSSKDHVKSVEGKSRSYAEAVAQGPASGSNILSSGQETSHQLSEGTSPGAAREVESFPLPARRLIRSPHVEGRGSESGLGDASSSKDLIKSVEGKSPSYAEVAAHGPASGRNILSSGQDVSHRQSEGTASGAATEIESFPLPAVRLRRSSHVGGSGSESGRGNASADDEILQTELPVSAGGEIVLSELPVSAGRSETPQPEGKDGELTRRKFQRTDQVMKDRFEEWEKAYMIETEQRKTDEMFMKEALLEARKAADNWEVPVGAVLVHDGRIIARGYNLVEELRDSTAHAEMICIREASNFLRTWRLSETTLYVTLEPCPMCAGAILQARIDTVVWGAPNKLLGADGSWIRLFPNGEGDHSSEPSDKPAAPVHPFHPKIKIRRNVLASECADSMQQFFRRRRKKEKQQEPPTPPSCLPIATHPAKFFTKMHDAFHMMFCL